MRPVTDVGQRTDATPETKRSGFFPPKGKFVRGILMSQLPFADALRIKSRDPQSYWATRRGSSLELLRTANQRQTLLQTTT
jgi:hypothetical protein